MSPILVFGICFASVVFAVPTARRLDVDLHKYVRHGNVLELNEQNARQQPVPDINKDKFVKNGDILLPSPKYARKRNLVVGENTIWEGGVVPFYIDPELEDKRGKIYILMNHISSRTCISFREKTDSDTEYIHIFKGPGCMSAVGRNGEAVPVSLGEYCEELIAGVHEIMHSLGFYHTQNRSDRDDYLIFHYENMMEGAAESLNWKKMNETENQLLVPFDFDSLMLYGPYAGSINGKPAMSAKDPIQKYTDIYEKPGMSDLDIKALNKLYNCQRYGPQYAYDD